MITLKSLLKDIEEKNKEIAKLKLEVVDAKAKDEENEAALWINTPFKEKKLTNDNMRKAYVRQQMGLLYPSFYASKKAKLSSLEAEVKWDYEMISVMKLFGVFEIDLEEKEKQEEEKNKNPK